MTAVGASVASADVVVLGGGIIGAAVTRELARRGVDVLLLDAGEPGGGTSGRCDGNVLVQTKHDALGVRMTRCSIAGYRQWQAELDVDFHFDQPGSLVFFTDDVAFEQARERTAWLVAAGVRARLLDGAEVRDLEPGLSETVVGGIDCLDDASVYPPAVVAALILDAQKHGARIMTRIRVHALTRSVTGAVTGVTTDRGLITAPRVVNALGVWAPQLRGTPEQPLPIRPRQGLLAVTDEAPGLVRRAVTEATYMTARTAPGSGDAASVSFVAEPTYRGNVLIGSTRRFCGYDTDVDLRLLREVMANAIRFLPGLADVPLIRTFAGLRPWTPDNHPVIGFSRAVPGYVLATGHEGEGIGLAPITSQVVAGLLTGEELTPLQRSVLDRAAPDRFAVRDQRAGATEAAS